MRPSAEGATITVSMASSRGSAASGSAPILSDSARSAPATSAACARAAALPDWSARERPGV